MQDEWNEIIYCHNIRPIKCNKGHILFENYESEDSNKTILMCDNTGCVVTYPINGYCKQYLGCGHHEENYWLSTEDEKPECTYEVHQCKLVKNTSLGLIPVWEPECEIDGDYNCRNYKFCGCIKSI